MPALKLFLGGSFDPIHNGHLATAEELLIKSQAQSLSLLPNALSPLKLQQFASPEQRKQMLELAVEHFNKLDIDWREVQRGGSSYTVDTLAELTAENPKHSLGFVMGQDSFNHLDKWHRWQELTEHAHLIVTARPGYSHLLSESLKTWLAPRQCQSAEQLQQSRSGKVLFIALKPYPVSSTEIRQACAGGGNLDKLAQLMPQTVAEFILNQGLYRA